MSLYSVCIATYRRPDGLARLLQSIEDQVIVDDCEVEIVVVDNDPGSAEDVVSQFAANSRFPVRYLTQSEPNISITRNVAVASALGEFIWFIDDDEVASPTCLAQLSMRSLPTMLTACSVRCCRNSRTERPSTLR